jgi:peptidoglycan/xylan/chitin deacetylase (PgdA/CDA1 family)
LRWLRRESSGQGDRPGEPRQGAVRRIAVLAYHKIGTSSIDSVTSYHTPQETFRAQLATLKAHGWSVVGIDVLLRGLALPQSLPERSVLITFDDGYRSVLELACPVLAEFGYPAVAFMPTDYIGQSSDFRATSEPTEPLCSLTDLRELEAAGVTVQSHGASHVKLSTLSPSEVEEELRRSKAVLEDGLGKTVEAFAYPYGDPGDSAVVALALEQSGYRAAFLYAGAPFRLPAANLYELPRLPMERDTNLSVELQRLIRSDRRQHLERATAARWRSLAHGRLDARALAALDSMLVRHASSTSRVIWVEPGLQPPRHQHALLSFPTPVHRSWQRFASAIEGSQSASWIAPSYAYEFRLRAGPDCEPVAAVTVVAEPPGLGPAFTAADQAMKRPDGPFLAAVPNPAPVEGTHASTTVHWSTGDDSTGVVEMAAYSIAEGLPEEDADAIAALEQLRARGGDFLLIAAACSWWLELYPGLGRHLSAHFPMVADEEPGRLYELRDVRRQRRRS